MRIDLSEGTDVVLDCLEMRDLLDEVVGQIEARELKVGVLEEKVEALVKLVRSMNYGMEWVSLTDVGEEEFKEKHKGVLGCVDKVEKMLDDMEGKGIKGKTAGLPLPLIGMFLCVRYYNNVWQSRSESTILSRYLGIDCGKMGYGPFYLDSKMEEKLLKNVEILEMLIRVDTVEVIERRRR